MNKDAKSHWKHVEKFMKKLSSEDLKPMEDWLNEYAKKNVVRHYRRQFEYYLYWSKKSPKQLIDGFDNKKAKNQLLQYQTHLLDHYAQNTARTMVQVVRAFYASQKEPVRGLKRKIVKIQLPKHEHTFSIEDLKAMHSIANTEDKAILSLACSLGYHARSFLNIERDHIETLVKRAQSQKEDFIMWSSQRVKTGAYRLSVLTPLAIHDLSNYLEKTKDEKTTKLFNINEDTLNKRLRSLVSEANIVTTGKVSFKLIRKWLMQSLNDSGLSEFETKLVLGKAIGQADLTYLQNIQKSAFEKYKKAYPLHLSLAMNVNGQAKYNELVDLTTRYIQAQQKLIDHMKAEGMLKSVPPVLISELEQVFEFSAIMRKKNGEKHEENNNQDQ